MVITPETVSVLKRELCLTESPQSVKRLRDDGRYATASKPVTQLLQLRTTPSKVSVPARHSPDGWDRPREPGFPHLWTGASWGNSRQVEGRQELRSRMGGINSR